MQNVRSIYQGLINGLVFLGTLASTGALAFMGLLITYEIIIRAVFGKSTLLADEMTGYLLVLLLFMGLAYTLRNEGMLRVEFLFNRLPYRARIWVEAACCLVAFVYMVILSYQSWMFFYESYDLGYTSVNPSGMRLWIPQLSIPIGCSLMVLEFMAHEGRLLHKLFLPEPK